MLIILAGVSINLVLGNNGIITRARDARNNYQKAAAEEETALKDLENMCFMKDSSKHYENVTAIFLI